MTPPVPGPQPPLISLSLRMCLSRGSHRNGTRRRVASSARTCSRVITLWCVSRTSFLSRARVTARGDRSPLIPSSADGPLECLHPSALVQNATLSVCTCVHVSMYAVWGRYTWAVRKQSGHCQCHANGCVDSPRVSRSETAGSQSTPTWNVLGSNRVPTGHV